MNWSQVSIITRSSLLISIGPFTTPPVNQLQTCALLIFLDIYRSAKCQEQRIPSGVLFVSL